MLGLLQHTHLVALPAGLTLLSSWYIVVASAVLFCVEFFGDKIPAFDLLWNALHTFIRVPVAALLAYRLRRRSRPASNLRQRSPAD